MYGCDIPSQFRHLLSPVRRVRIHGFDFSDRTLTFIEKFMTTKSTQPAPVVLSAVNSDLCVEFCWTGDRYGHRVLCGETVLAESVEGTSDDVWPDGGPLQQLSLETIGDKDIVFGVGAAGQSHWSLSVELVDDDSGASVKFDWACRTSGRPQFLGSRYRTDPTAVFGGLGQTQVDSADQQTTAQCDLASISSAQPPVSSGLTGQWTYTVTVAR